MHLWLWFSRLLISFKLLKVGFLVYRRSCCSSVMLSLMFHDTLLCTLFSASLRFTSGWGVSLMLPHSLCWQCAGRVEPATPFRNLQSTPGCALAAGNRPRPCQLWLVAWMLLCGSWFPAALSGSQSAPCWRKHDVSAVCGSVWRCAETWTVVFNMCDVIWFNCRDKLTDLNTW